MPYKLDDLGYAYNALEPVLDEQTMHLHHDKHHAAYVDKLNNLLSDTGSDRSLEDLVINIDDVAGTPDYRANVRFNAGGHYNHAMFWEILSPNGSNHPSGELEKIIVRVFGGFEQFKEQFERSALSHLGSGWTWLCIDQNKRDEVFICSTLNHDNPLMRGHSARLGYPILLLDLWEHSYYLGYNNRKAEYFKAFWKIVNWDIVAERFGKY